MKGFVVCGTDTDAGKTTFCQHFLAAFPDEFAYWKPVETGESDTERIRAAVPNATVFDPIMRFEEAVAPTLAAEREGRVMPTIDEVIAAIPTTDKRILLETFGSPLSPFGGPFPFENGFTHGVLQAELLATLGWPIILVGTTAVGAVGRTLQACAGLRGYGLKPTVILLIGPKDEHAITQLSCHVQSCFVTLDFSQWLLDAPIPIRETNHLQFMMNVIRREFFGPPCDCPDCIPVDNIARDRNVLWHPYTALQGTDDPLEFVGAQAEFLELADGRRIIDAISSWWTIQHGHRHPPLMNALRQAMTKFDHVMFAGITHEPAISLAEWLLGSCPWTGGRVFYSDNGSTAVEVALKMAYQAWCHRGEPGRTLFVGFENGYHGDTFGAMAAGRDPLFFAKFDPLLFRTLRVPVSAARLAEVLDQHPAQVAAIILEPLVQGAGGMRMHSPKELKAIFDMCRERGVYFIADEVMTGGGRTGTFWAHTQAGIAPDFICAAKTLAGGILPLAATLIAPHIVELFQCADRTKTFFHGHSFTANPLACAVAVENLRIMQSGEWKRNIERIEAFWKQSFKGVPNVRILGSIAAIEVQAEGGYLAEIGRTMGRAALGEGVLLRPLGNVIYAMPPYCTGNASLERIANAMKKAITSQ